MPGACTVADRAAFLDFLGRPSECYASDGGTHCAYSWSAGYEECAAPVTPPGEVSLA